MPYVKWFDERYGDLFEIYYSEEGEFEGAMRSVGEVGRDPIYYHSLGELPAYHRNKIESLLWKRTHPQKE